ncbi:hypothetical protein GJR96_06445 [Haloferax sp. MBLA0076]|uniref:Uncharacterized protein n=1 Tax=Haloferax litoreum TaxID=2666140 RepID=A0A6A8GEN1_9EURY|nr:MULTISPECIES: hypothetical protein [Haloferax]KAB1193100.1 hypothetical protein Hfx1148_06435 [Haloferax sp. CBA1148]MRX21593.1 hypothetical protein [Haloferax litoreum]
MNPVYPLLSIVFGLIGTATGVFIVRTPSRAMAVLMPLNPSNPSRMTIRAYRAIGVAGILGGLFFISLGLVGLSLVF